MKPYTYHRDTDGCADTFTITTQDRKYIAHVAFWDEPDTTEASAAEAAAKMIVEALNALARSPKKKVRFT